MIATLHPRELGLGHVAVDADVARTVGRVMCVVSRARDTPLVTGHASVVRLIAFVPVAPAGRMAVQTVQLAGHDARTHQPRRIRVVLAQVAPVGIEIRMLERHQIVVVEELIARLEARRQRDHLGVAGTTGGVRLLRRELLVADDRKLLTRTVRISLAGAYVVGCRAVTRLAVDPRLQPDRTIAVGLQIVVCRELADVTAVTRRVERERPLSPIQRLVLMIGEVPHHARRSVVPSPLADVVGHR